MLWPKLSRASRTGTSKTSSSSRTWASSIATIVPCPGRRCRASDGSRATTRAARSTFFFEHVAADHRCAVEHRPDDRAVDRMLQQLRPSAQVARVIAAKRDGRRRDLFPQIITGQFMLTGSNGANATVRSGDATAGSSGDVSGDASRCLDQPAGHSRKRPSRVLVFVFRMAIFQPSHPTRLPSSAWDSFRHNLQLLRSFHWQGSCHARNGTARDRRSR